jgi:hypothetical protein
VLSVATLVLLVTACASGGSAGTSSSTTTSAAVAQQTCQRVDAALSDGPDPSSDPVGYAEAQILPLKQIHTSDATLGKAITTLEVGYSRYYTADGHGASVGSALNSAVTTINKLCPGAGASE